MQVKGRAQKTITVNNIRHNFITAVVNTTIEPKNAIAHHFLTSMNTVGDKGHAVAIKTGKIQQLFKSTMKSNSQFAYCSLLVRTPEMTGIHR